MIKKTLISYFQSIASKYADAPAILHKKKAKFVPITYAELAEQVRVFASGLRALGTENGDRIGLISENRPEWAIADLALIHLGAINVAMFPTLPYEQVKYIALETEIKLLVVSGKAHLEKGLKLKEHFPTLTIVTMDCPEDPSRNVVTFSRVMELGRENLMSQEEFEKLWSSVEPDDIATIIYTSGTSGIPKGVMLTHTNFVSNIEASLEAIPFKPNEVILSVLPLNHVLPRMADHYTPLCTGSTIAYAEDYAKVRDNAVEVKPHYITLVPRFFESIKEKLEEAFSKEPEGRRRTLEWAMGIGEKRCKLIQDGRRVPLALAVKWMIANRLVLSKVRAKMGMSRLRNFISGGAALPKATAEFFASLGLIILEGYGLTETSPVVSVNRARDFRFGTVGRPLRGIEVRIAEDGEILVRGHCVMKGYYKKPAETSDAIDEEGWFHTGDIGELDDRGYLRITDRKKDIIVLASGKKVAPQAIENKLQESPYINQVVLIGDGYTTVTALIVPNWEKIKEWASIFKLKLPLEKKSDLAESPEVKQLIKAEIQRLSAGLADFEKVHRFTILLDEISIEGGELTPTLKVRRKFVSEKYADLIAEMYR